MFVFRAEPFGNDEIVDFDAGPDGGDVMDLSALQNAGFDALMARASKTDAGTLIEADFGSIDLSGVELESLVADDFALT